MAFFNEINIGRYNRMLQKLLQMKGGPPARQLASEVTPAIELERVSAELRYLVGWARFGAAVVVAASAGNTSGVRVRNPVGSNVLAVVERLSFSTTLQDRPVLRQSSVGVVTDLGTISATNANNLDSRSQPGTTMIVSLQNSAATVPALPNAFTLEAPNMLANTTYPWIYFDNQELTVLPGSGIQFEAGAVNEGITFAILWRERLLEESERT